MLFFVLAIVVNQLITSLFLSVFCLLLLLPGIAKMPVIDRDEAHFAQASRQMMQTNHYFQIRFQDQTRFQKPPGINWLQAASVKSFSEINTNSIWPYRLPSVLSALLSVWLSYFFFRRFVGQKPAILAAGLLAASLLLVIEAHMAVIDTALLSSVVLMQGALWVIYQQGLDRQPVHWGCALCFWLAMTYGLLLKGVTPLVAGLSIVSLILIEKRGDWLAGLRLYRGVFLVGLLSFAWLFLLNAGEESNYLWQMIHKDLLPKLQGGHESHGQPPLFHLLILAFTFWPASLFLWQGGCYAVANRHSAVVRFLLAWLLPTWLFFELMPTKLPHYVLPTFPALALLCSLAILQTDKSTIPGKWLHFLQLGWGLLSLCLALGFLIVPYLLIQQLTLIGLALFVIITLMSFIAVYLAWYANYYAASGVVCLMALLSYPLIFSGLLPQLEPLWLTRNVVNKFNITTLSTAKPLLAVGFDEPSLVFNLNTKLVQFTDSQTAKQLLMSEPNRLALVEASIFETWGDKTSVKIVARTRGYHYTKGRWVELFLVRPTNKGEG